MNNNLTYQSLEHNLLDNQNMTNLHQIFPENNQHVVDDFACLHCGKDLSDEDKQKNTHIDTKQKDKQMVLNRGLYSDLLEPEYYRYNKSIKMDIDDVGRKYLQYKPRRPKCPIMFKKYTPDNKPHLIENPLYNYPVSNNIQNIEKQWMNTFVDKNESFVKNLYDMMDEYDSATTF